jgi:hypothetical protein
MRYETQDKLLLLAFVGWVVWMAILLVDGLA